MIHFILCSNFTFRSLDFSLQAHSRVEWRENQIMQKYRADSALQIIPWMFSEDSSDRTNSVKNENRMPVRYFYYFWDEILQLKLSASIKLWMEENFKFKLTQIVPVLRSTFPGKLSRTRSVGTPSLTGGMREVVVVANLPNTLRLCMWQCDILSGYLPLWHNDITYLYQLYVVYVSLALRDLVIEVASAGFLFPFD